MRNGVRFFEPRDLHHSLGDEREGDAGDEKILAFVNRACLKHRENKITREFLLQIIDVTFGGAGAECLCYQPVEFVFLADVSAKGDDLSLIIFLEPTKNDLGVKPTGIGENNL